MGPSHFSSYRIIEKLGEGGMSNVYLGQHIHINRKVAIKFLNEKYATNNNIRQRFKNEASTLSNLQHPNVVAFYDYIEANDSIGLIMEYVPGETLEDQLKTSGKFNIKCCKLCT